MNPDADAPTRVIDTHVHVWSTAAEWMTWLDDHTGVWDRVKRDFSWSDLRGEMDDAGVSEVILVQAGTATAETQELLELAATQPRIPGVVGWATLSSAAATERDLDGFVGPGADKLVGIRNNHGWEPDGDIVARPDVVGSCTVLAEHGLPLDLHFHDHVELELAQPLAERVPGCRFVIDHLGKPPIGVADSFEPWAKTMARLGELPNVYVKFSGWATRLGRVLAADVRPYLDTVLDAFGSSRVMYGGNWPVALLGGTFGDTFAASLAAIADLSEHDRTNILHATAMRCYLSGE